MGRRLGDSQIAGFGDKKTVMFFDAKGNVRRGSWLLKR